MRQPPSPPARRSGRLARAIRPAVFGALAGFAALTGASIWAPAVQASESRLATNLADMAEVRAEMMESLQAHRRQMAAGRVDAARSLQIHRQNMAEVRADMDASRAMLLQRMREARER